MYNWSPTNSVAVTPLVTLDTRTLGDGNIIPPFDDDDDGEPVATLDVADLPLVE